MSERVFLVGVDVGTQAVRSGLFSLRGRCLGRAMAASRPSIASPGIVEEDSEFQLASACRCIRRCLEQAGVPAAAVAGLAVAGQMAGVIGIGADGRAVTPYDSWLDTRCAPYIQRMQREAGREIIRRTGGPVSFNHAPKILWWMHERPAIHRRIARFVQPGAYVAMRLCGLGAAEAFIDPTYLHFSGLADNRRLRWAPDLCRAFGVSPDKLPRIVPSQQVVGTVQPAMARRCGLKAGTAVVAGCGDTAASFLSCGATREGVCVDVAGTASVFAATTRSCRPDVQGMMLSWARSAQAGLWHPYAYINGGGMNLEWFRRLLSAAGPEAPPLSALDRLASRLEIREDAPMFVPHLCGRVNPSSPNLRGAWAGIDWSHTAADLYRSVLESVALEYAIYQAAILRRVPSLRMRQLRVTGGGQRSRLWNRIKADVLQMPVVAIARGEGAAMGAAMLAGVGVGAFRSLGEAADRWVHKTAGTRPDKSMAGHYSRRIRRYQVLLKQLNDFGLR